MPMGATEAMVDILESVCAVLTGMDAVFIVDAVNGEMSMEMFPWEEEGVIVEGMDAGRFSMTGALDEITEGDATDEMGTTRGET